MPGFKKRTLSSHHLPPRAGSPAVIDRFRLERTLTDADGDDELRLPDGWVN